MTTLGFIVGPPAVGKTSVGHELAQRASLFVELDAKYHLNSRGAFERRPDYFRVDNIELSAAQAAELIIERFGLTRVDAQPGS